MMKKVLIIFLCFIPALSSFSQNISFARDIIDTLSSPEFFGRGYVNSGERKAADFIAEHLQKSNIQAFKSGYLQFFNIKINTFPGAVDLKINNKKMTPGIDFIIYPDAPKTDAGFVARFLNEKTYSKGDSAKALNNLKIKNKAIVIDTGFKDVKNRKLNEAAVRVNIVDRNVSWHVSGAEAQNKQIRIDVRRTAIPEKIKKIALKIDARLIDDYQTQNVVGFLPGKACPDTFLVIGAHYDHLGMMGNQAYFPGANDNASGTAMLLDLANYFSDTTHMGKYSIAFIFFTGEEAGLLGSEYFTGHPLFPLKNIKFMLNIDMVGTGSDGIKVVNGSVFKNEFETLTSLNQKNNYLKTVSPRGEAANSDHYYFFKNGVKSFFIYTLGNEYKEYHTVTDKAAGLPLTKYNEVFKLVVDFMKSF